MRWIARQAARALVPVAEAADALGGVVSGATPAPEVGASADRASAVAAAGGAMGARAGLARLLFAHWRVAAEQLRSHVPAALELDPFDGDAWLSVTPFEVRGSRARGVPPPPVLSRFPELNVRTYVTHAQRPGIWFFSLDAGSGLAVAAARTAYRLPYFRARMASMPSKTRGSTTAASGWTGAERPRRCARGTGRSAVTATRSPARWRRGWSSATACNRAPRGGLRDGHPSPAVDAPGRPTPS
jgi:hypothetical protein